MLDMMQKIKAEKSTNISNFIMMDNVEKTEKTAQERWRLT